MIILKVVTRRDYPFVQIDKRILDDPRLSWRAKGIFIYLFSRPDGWKVIITDLCNRSTDGETSVWSALRELRGAGYYQIKPIRNAKGQLTDRQMVIQEKPLTQIPGNPSWGNPESGEPPVCTNNDRDTTYHSVQRKNCRRKGSRCSPRLPSTMHGFFSLADEVDPFVIKACTILEDYVRSSRRLNGKRINLRSWCDQMRLLLADLDGDKARLKKVLKPFIALPHTSFTPQVQCAESFRKKFLRIEDWASQQTSTAPQYVAPQYEVFHLGRVKEGEEDGA